MEVFRSSSTNGDNGIRMFVRDPGCIIEEMFNLVSPDNWEMYVQIMYLQQVWSFTGKLLNL